MTTKPFFIWDNPIKLEFGNINFNRYIEVLVGAGSLYFTIPNKTKCLINDPNTDLIQFYRNAGNKEFIDEITVFSFQWKLIERFSLDSVNELFQSFLDYSDGIISKTDLNFIVRAIILMHLDNPKYLTFTKHDFVVSSDMFINSIIKCIVQELDRLKTKVDKENFTPSASDEFIRNIETSFRCGFYSHFLNLYNWKKLDLVSNISEPKLTAIWFFLSQVSNGAKIQYDKNGNIKNQYGGESFNYYNFTPAIDSIINNKIQSRIENTIFWNMTPELFLSTFKFEPDDFVVLNLTDDNQIYSTNNRFYKEQYINLITILNKLNNKWVVITDTVPDKSFELNITEVMVKKPKQITKSVYMLKKYL